MATSAAVKNWAVDASSFVSAARLVLSVADVCGPATVASLVVQATGARETVSWTASSTTSANAVGSRVNDVSPGWVVPPQPARNAALAVSSRGIAGDFIA